MTGRIATNTLPWPALPDPVGKDRPGKTLRVKLSRESCKNDHFKQKGWLRGVIPKFWSLKP